jgi:type II secretory pathway pseudopilin PulG
MKFFFKKTNNKSYSVKSWKSRGYTIIETMIAVSVFLVIILSGMGALLNANLLDNKSKEMRSIMDNLSFIMEDISRNLRTGYNYHCGSLSNLDNPESCANGGILAFEEASGNVETTNDQWVYKIESTDGGATYNISKSVLGGALGSFVQLNSSEIVLQSVSGFSVFGAQPPFSNNQQPLVIIRLIGIINSKDTVTPFSLQTSVSQRFLDIAS